MGLSKSNVVHTVLPVEHPDRPPYGFGLLEKTRLMMRFGIIPARMRDLTEVASAEMMKGMPDDNEIMDKVRDYACKVTDLIREHKIGGERGEKVAKELREIAKCDKDKDKDKD